MRKAGKIAMDNCALPNAIEPSPILLSSIGSLSRFPWFSSRVSPNHFFMFPTPVKKSINVVLWSNGVSQVITLGINEKYLFEKQDTIDKILVAWRKRVNDR